MLELWFSSEISGVIASCIGTEHSVSSCAPGMARRPPPLAGDSRCCRRTAVRAVVLEDGNMTAERRHGVFNHADGVWAWPFPVVLKEAEEFVNEFIQPYKRQGYYRTASGKRIRTEDVELGIVSADGE